MFTYFCLECLTEARDLKTEYTSQRGQLAQADKSISTMQALSKWFLSICFRQKRGECIE
jgi:hypothetical protein